MQHILNLTADNNVSPSIKKIWLKPEVEIIDQDIIESGQAGFLPESINIHILPAVSYNS
jgi:hypothetical protein